MKAIATILIVAVFVGLASAAWLMALIMLASKKVKDKAVLKRWLKMQGLLLIVVALMAGCSPGKMVGTGFLVSIKKDGHTQIQKVATRHQSRPAGTGRSFLRVPQSRTVHLHRKKGHLREKRETPVESV